MECDGGDAAAKGLGVEGEKKSKGDVLPASAPKKLSLAASVGKTPSGTQFALVPVGSSQDSRLILHSSSGIRDLAGPAASHGSIGQENNYRCKTVVKLHYHCNPIFLSGFPYAQLFCSVGTLSLRTQIHESASSAGALPMPSASQYLVQTQMPSPYFHTCIKIYCK